MKNFIIGAICGTILSGQIASAVEVSFDKITLKDLYCGFALCGLCAGCGIPDNPNNINIVVQSADRYGSTLAQVRGK